MSNESHRTRSSEVFVGRERELTFLRDRLDAASRSEAGILFIAGEPGIGKTALCEQLAAYADEAGAQTLFGHCYDEGSLPYLPFVEALRSYAGMRDLDTLRQELGAGTADIARLMPEIGSVLAVEPRPAGDPEADRWQLFEAVGTVLRNAGAAQPLLLILEDLHWADRGTLELLVHVERNLRESRVFVVGTYRDVEVDRAHPLSTALGQLRRIRDFHRVSLQGLDLGDVHLLYKELRDDEVTLSEAARVRGQTEGNPLFVQEVVRNLAELGLTAPERAETTSAIPEGLRDVIGLRLNRLSQDCNQALAVASVIGREFDMAALQRVAGLEEERLVSALEEAERAGVLLDESRPGAIRYRFAHALFRQTLYEDISTPRRLRHHQQVARVLEAQYASRLEDHAAELAEHFSHSTDRDDLAKAVYYFELAAGRATSVFAYGEAVRLLERALDAQELSNIEDKARRANLLVRLGELMSFVGESASPRRLDYFSRSLALYEEIDDEPSAAKVHATLGFFYSLGGVMDLAQSHAHLEAAESILAREPTDPTLLRVYVTLARLAWWEMHTHEGLRLSLAAMEKAEELGDEAQRTMAAVARGYHLMASGDLAASLEVLSLNRRRVDQLDDKMAQSHAGIVSAAPTGAAAFLLADPTESLACYDHELGHTRHQTQALGHDQIRYFRAAALALAGDLNEAIKLTDELPDAGGPAAPGYPHPFVAFWCGDWLRAESLWRKEIELNEGRGNRWSLSTFRIWLAKVLLVRGDSSGSEALLSSLLDTGINAPNVPMVLIARTELALLCASTARLEEAIPHLARCQEIVAKGEDWRGLGGRVALAEAAVAVAEGDLAAAEPYFGKAIETFERYSLPWDKAEALHLWGRALIRARRRAAAVAKLDAALEIYRVHGAGQPWIDRVEADKERLLAGGSTTSIYPDGLSEREVEVLRLIAAGKSNQQIADELVLSVHTVINHVSSIFTKSGVANRAEATAYAARRGLLAEEPT